MKLKIKKHSDAYYLTAFTLLFLFCFSVSFMLGRYPVTFSELVKILLSKIFPIPVTWASQAETVVIGVRLPRVLAASLIGAALSAAGICYQGLFQNPMVSPDVLGASAGAGFGAAMGLFFSFSYLGVSLSSFAFGMTAVLIVQFISGRVRSQPVMGLILSGMMIGSLFSSATSFIKLVADPTNVLPSITYWLMGSLASIRPRDLLFAFIPIFAGIVPLILLRWRLNVLTLGEEEARSMGINTKLLRGTVILCATLMTAACVSISGMIGWVGLVIPHFTRMLVGCDYRISLPSSMLLGASFLLVVDNFSRLLTTSEIPLGILTAYVGAPFFLYLILREGKKL
ncbi:MAG: iron ABC transporter permease [Oscillospiraceae bacterium]